MTETAQTTEPKSELPKWFRKAAIGTIGVGMITYALSGISGCDSNAVTYHSATPHDLHLERRIEALEKGQEDDWGLLEYSLLGTAGLAGAAGVGYWLGHRNNKPRIIYRTADVLRKQIAN